MVDRLARRLGFPKKAEGLQWIAVRDSECGMESIDTRRPVEDSNSSQVVLLIVAIFSVVVACCSIRCVKLEDWAFGE